MFQQLTYGDAGPEVEELHRRLERLGFLGESGGPSYAEMTRMAVAAFQESRGLDPTGTCDDPTWRALLEAEHQFGDRPLYLTAPMLRGDDVAALQLRLGALGFDAGRVDGIFGPNTQRAVREFQRNVDIIVDGVCARDTVEQLERLSTRGGTVGWTVRLTSPSRSRPRSVSVSMRCEMPSIRRCRSLNRMRPSPSSRTTSTAHLSPMRASTVVTKRQLAETWGPVGTSLCVGSMSVPPCADVGRYFMSLSYKP